MTLRWFYGTMAAGKSTLALQTDHSYREGGRKGILLTSRDRTGEPVISSRLGVWKPAIEVTPDLNIYQLVVDRRRNEDISYVIADEAQFYTVEQIDQLGRIVDDFAIEVSAYGISSDFQANLFPGSTRLFAIADEHCRLPVPARCWCGHPALFNARVVDNQMVLHGDQVVVGDTVHTESHIRYVLLCRRHYRACEPTPSAAA